MAKRGGTLLAGYLRCAHVPCIHPWYDKKKAQTLSRGLGLLLWGSGVHDSPHRENRGGCNTGNLANSHLAVVAQGQYAIFRSLQNSQALP